MTTKTSFSQMTWSGSDFTLMASECDRVSPSVPPQYRDFIVICGGTHTLQSDNTAAPESQHHQQTGLQCVSHLESVVGHVTDVDDVVRRITEHLSKPEGMNKNTNYNWNNIKLKLNPSVQ